MTRNWETSTRSRSFSFERDAYRRNSTNKHSCRPAVGLSALIEAERKSPHFMKLRKIHSHHTPNKQYGLTPGRQSGSPPPSSRRPSNNRMALSSTRWTFQRLESRCHRARYHCGTGVTCGGWSMAPGSRTLTYTPARLVWSDISTRSRNAAVSRHGDVFLSSRRQVLAMACLQSAGARPDLRAD